MSMAMDKPTKVEVGQRWKMRDGREMAVARYDAKFSPFPWRVFDETNCREDGLQDGFERNCTFLGWAEGFAPSPSSPGRPAGRDWSMWLSPKPLPDTGEKTFAVGQVFATTALASGQQVVRITGITGRKVTYELLAGKDCGGANFEPGSTYGRRCILVADVGCEPTPPEVLYGPRSSTQGEPGAADKVSCVDCAADITDRVKAAVVGGGWRCVPCNGEFHTRVILAKRKPAPTVTSKPRRAIPASCQLERWDETGPLSALGAVPSRQPPEPWRPSVTDEDLLPDAGTSWSYSKPSSPGGGE